MLEALQGRAEVQAAREGRDELPAEHRLLRSGMSHGTLPGREAAWCLESVSATVTTSSAAHPSKEPLKNEMTLSKRLQA